MIKKNLFAALIMILFQLNSNAQSMCQNLSSATEKDKFSIELIPVVKGKLLLVKFTIPEDCYVNIKIADYESNDIKELVRDDMPAGSYSVYYSFEKTIFNGANKCVMVVSKNAESLNKVIYSREIFLPTK